MKPNKDSTEHVLILALTYGEPPHADYEAQRAYSRLILQRLTSRIAPWYFRLLIPMISRKRGRARVATWQVEDYSSPLEQISEQQARDLASALSQRDPGRRYDVRVQLEFRHPLLAETLPDILKNPPDKLLLLPLYLADSDFTTGISKDDLRAYTKRHGPIRPQPTYVAAFSEDDRVADLMARFVLEQLDAAGWNEADCREAALLLGVHGTLVEVTGRPDVDTGLGTTQCFYQRLAERLGPRFAYHSVGWLNHNVGGTWTSPDLETAAADVVKRGIGKVVYFPFGFFADNAETELEGRCILREQPSLKVLHLPSLNTWPPFIDYLATRILETLDQAGASPRTD